jgi:SNF2 family DNA or RNA helicase
MELWAHQKQAIEKAKTVSNLALFMDMGTGKTATVIHIIRHLFNSNSRYMRTLIVCPKSVMENWKKEILRFSEIPKGKIFPLKGTLAQRVEVYNKAPEGSIFITNYESFAYPLFAKAIDNMPPEVMILDESHRVKSTTSKRTKALIKVSEAMSRKFKKPYRYIMSGSPVLNNELDLFTQFLILDQGKTLGRNFFAYRATYFTDKNAFMPKHIHFPKWVVRPESTEKLKQLIAPICVTAKKEECLDLPPLVKMEVEVELSPEQKKSYDMMEKDFISFVGQDTSPAVATIALTKVLRMQQILSGFLSTEDGVKSFEENPRADVLKELLEDYAEGQKVIVWAIFKHDYEVIRKICERLCVEYAEVTGEISDKQAELDRFEKDPKCRVMIASPQAGGTGVNMIEASVMIYYSRSYNLEHDMQSEARNYRGGSEKHAKITRIDLVAKNTIDTAILEALQNKHNLAKNITQLKNWMK